MTVILIIVGVLAWLIIGGTSFIWFWTKEFDLKGEEIPILIFCAVAGIATFMALATMASKNNFMTHVLIKRRK